jgi:hypothetical protein
VFTTAGGTAVLTDALALGRNDRGHDLGAGSPGLLLRQLVCTSGEIDAEVSYAPRPEYGLIRPFLTRKLGSRWRAAANLDLSGGKVSGERRRLSGGKTGMPAGGGSRLRGQGAG